MKGASNVIPVIDLLVSQMTPVVTITANVVDGDNWKLSACQTYWLTTGMTITIDGDSYRIESFVQDDYIIVSGAAQPVVTTFQLDAPDFWHGSRRKVNNERSETIDVTRWVVYLPIPRVTENNDPETDFVYSAEIRPLFLFAYDEQLDTIDLQQTNVIEPANAMADFFLYLINDQEENFNTPTDIDRYEWMNFGDESVWGKDKLIFDGPLSGVEQRLNIEVMPDGLCVCEDAPAITCLPGNVYINGVFEDTAPSGEDFLLIVKDTNLLPVGTYDEPSKTITVPAATGGGGSIDIAVNGTPFYTGVSTNQDLPVLRASDDQPTGFKLGSVWYIDGATINLNDVNIYNAAPDETINAYVKDSASNNIGTPSYPDTVVANSTVNIKDSAGTTLHTVSVLAEGSANQTVSDATQTMNAVAITSQLPETAKTFVIRYANNDPVTVTTITDTSTSFIGEVPDLEFTYDVYFDGVDTTQDVVIDGTNITINLE